MKEQIQQPKSLKIFFATELWERYGFYVTQSLLALFLAIQHHWPDKKIYQLVGTFTALTYLSPIVGGWIADHWLGQKKSIITGALVLFVSYIILGVAHSETMFIFSLSSIAVGTGLLKPNISSLVGNQYKENDPNRSKGFTIFYMGITLGIILGTTIPSYLVAKFGWQSTFFSASLGMLFSLFIFILGIKYYSIPDYIKLKINYKKITYTILTVLTLNITSFLLLSQPTLADNSFIIVCAAAILYLTQCLLKDTGSQKIKTALIMSLCIISVMFWAFYFQMFLALTMFLARVVQPNLFHISFPPPYYVALQSFGMLFFGALITKIPNNYFINNILLPLKKFCFSMLITLIAYMWILLSIKLNFNYSLIPAAFFIPAYLLISIAELFLSPVGLSAITELADKKKVSTMMGIFFVSLGIGAFLAGKLAFYTAIDASYISHIYIIKQHYFEGFIKLTTILLICTVISYNILLLFKKNLFSKIDI